MRLSGRVVILPPSERGFRRLKEASGRNFMKCARQHAGGNRQRAKVSLARIRRVKAPSYKQEWNRGIAASVDRRVNGGFLLLLLIRKEQLCFLSGYERIFRP